MYRQNEFMIIDMNNLYYTMNGFHREFGSGNMILEFPPKKISQFLLTIRFPFFFEMTDFIDITK